MTDDINKRLAVGPFKILFDYRDGGLPMWTVYDARGRIVATWLGRVAQWEYHIDAESPDAT